MITEITPGQALCHLFFHCCAKDGMFEEGEIDYVAAKFVELDMNRSLDFKNEVSLYYEERRKLPDEREYIIHLLKIINPVNTLALFSWCVEICLSDELISIDEDHLLDTIASLLETGETEKKIIKAVMVERKVAQLKQIV